MENALEKQYTELKKLYQQYLNDPVNLNLKRGVPSKEQLALSEPMLTVLNETDSFVSKDGTDIRNYGSLTGIIEAKEFFADLLEVEAHEVIVGGNSSLQLMHLVLSSLIKHKKDIAANSWKNEGKRKMLCPSPGYDRHFALADYLGFELVPITLKEDGPDMEQVQTLVANDDSIKAIWCVPTYSNPTGITYSNEVVHALSHMQTAAEDFTIMWDNAYVVHHLNQEHEAALNLLEACKEAGNPERPWLFCSTSKVTFPGAGVAAVASSEKNIKWLSEPLSFQTIGFDKLNQMRHVKFLKDRKHLLEHMEKHAAILKPKFDLIVHQLEKNFQGKEIVQWTNPNGGYFIHLTTQENCAEKTVEALGAIGVHLTEANATYPYGENPLDNSIRLAPTSVSLSDLEMAMDRICLCLELVALENKIRKK
ncbi:aminotransferase class I/II-fold pyridoxal phosphate-dependent enzyme [Pisciglobus halotolerans]|uniref:DNA-binding transcriptional regulator, MocR family, contains an aminotransferase domain n=1 Tax=Pisciglobus halotolerans TaxID=745365 RepID=A0A1I3CDW8_9LACT|nr:aminotransferase class I/II-fold pyridoxal phosphate-dependent enzyme [Pisciglobus halotolerans]SFH72707.1 DNA-binding transcriptional regulator, MocR family, contains an aminotransferase domain [Pisciglobus halotolerans]